MNDAPTSDHALRQSLAYRRFAGPPRVLVLDSSYYAVADVIAGARALGWDAQVLPTPSHGPAQGRFAIDLLSAVVRHRPDFLLTINHRGFDGAGALSGLLADYQIPLASWFIDHPLPILGPAKGCATAFTQLFCVERTALPWLTAQGYLDPVHLQSAASAACHPDAVSAACAERPALLGLPGPLTLVGQSWWGIARKDPEPAVRAAAGRLLSCRVLDREYVGRRLLAELPRLQLGLPAEPGAASQGLDAATCRAVYVALAEQSLRLRARLGGALQPLGLRVFGDEHWADLVPGLELRPMVDSQREAPTIYARSAVSLSSSAASLPTAANLRTWDVPGAGGLLLTDAQEDVLAAFREDEEVLVYRDAAEAADKARHYLGRPDERAAIARRAHEKVERAHRYPHRLQQLYQTMRARFA